MAGKNTFSVPNFYLSMNINALGEATGLMSLTVPHILRGGRGSCIVLKVNVFLITCVHVVCLCVWYRIEDSDDMSMLGYSLCRLHTKMISEGGHTGETGTLTYPGVHTCSADLVYSLCSV